MIIKDMIENNVQFDIDISNEVLLSLLIADRERKSRKYKYIIENRGHDFIPYCIASRKFLRQTSRYVRIRLHKTRWIWLHKAIDRGVEYEKAPILIKRKYEF
jgi:hypothetical protein